MAAGLGFKDFQTGEVLTAADVDGYLMQGVWVFASAAARDAAVTSPQEGNFAYLKDTNVTTYYTGSAWANLDTTGMTNPMTTTGDTIYSSSGSTPARLGIGTTGQVLTVAAGVPSWATPATASSDYKLINTTSFSSVASQSVNSVFTSTYTNYKLIFNIDPGTADSITFVLRASGVDTTANYASARMGWNGSVQFNGNNNTGTDDWYIGFDASASQHNAGDMTLFKPQAATQTSFICFGKTGTLIPQIAAGTQTDSTQFDGFTLSIISGTFTGTVSTYGLAK